MSEPEIRYLGDLQKLKIEPGDKFVLSIDAYVTSDMAGHIRNQWEQFAGKGVPILILDKGMKLGAMAA